MRSGSRKSCQQSLIYRILTYKCVFSSSLCSLPTPVFLPGESQGWGSLLGCRLQGRTESDTTEATQQQQQCIHVHPNLSIRPTIPFPAVPTWLFSMSEPLFLTWKYVHLHHFSRFHIYALIHCFSLSDLTSLCTTHSRSIHLSTDDPISFLVSSTNVPISDLKLTHTQR